jgi:hypothetical protein
MRPKAAIETGANLKLHQTAQAQMIARELQFAENIHATIGK